MQASESSMTPCEAIISKCVCSLNQEWPGCLRSIDDEMLHSYDDKWEMQGYDNKNHNPLFLLIIYSYFTCFCGAYGTR